MMQQAAKLQFERIVEEFVRWHDIPEPERSPAPAWWWGPAFEVRNTNLGLPQEWASRLKLADGATYADGAKMFLALFPGQDFLPWPDEFPRKPAPSAAAGPGSP